MDIAAGLRGEPTIPRSTFAGASWSQRVSQRPESRADPAESVPQSSQRASQHLGVNDTAELHRNTMPHSTAGLHRNPFLSCSRSRTMVSMSHGYYAPMTPMLPPRQPAPSVLVGPAQLCGDPPIVCPPGWQCVDEGGATVCVEPHAPYRRLLASSRRRRRPIQAAMLATLFAPRPYRVSVLR